MSSVEVNTTLAAEYDAEARLLAARAERDKQDLAYRTVRDELLAAYPVEERQLPPMPGPGPEVLEQ